MPRNSVPLVSTLLTSRCEARMYDGYCLQKPLQILVSQDRNKQWRCEKEQATSTYFDFKRRYVPAPASSERSLLSTPSQSQRCKAGHENQTVSIE